MLGYIAKRLLATLPVLFVISVVAFAMVHLTPGDPVLALIGQNGVRMDPAQVEQLRHELGLDAPLYVQYLTFAGNALTGDFGRSVITGQPVLREILGQLPQTLKLTVASMAMAIVLGVTLGVLAAVRHRQWTDNISMVLALVGVSMPSFWIGLMLIFVFSVRIGWIPVLGQGGIKELILPAVTLALGASAIIARMIRSGMLEVLRQDYISTARAKGLAERSVITRHALKNALIPTITIVGVQFGELLAGTVVVETVFSRQGMGRLIVGAIIARDFPVIQGTVVFTAGIYVVANLLVDITYTFLNPQIRHG